MAKVRSTKKSGDLAIYAYRDHNDKIRYGNYGQYIQMQLRLGDISIEDIKSE